MSKVEKLKSFFSQSADLTVSDYQKTICQFGLVHDTAPWQYGAERQYMLPLRTDLGIYQTPIQFAQLLKFLEQFQINSYAEIGVFHGGTFLFMKYFLQKRLPSVELCAVDPRDFLHAEAASEINRYLIKATSDALSTRKFDCVFIDGDHTYDWVKRDYNNVGRAAKICIFHDINEPACPGVISFWNEVKQGKRFVEFTDVIDGKGHGIGVLLQD